MKRNSKKRDSKEDVAPPIPLRMWDPMILADPKVKYAMAVIAPRNCGKSTLMMDCISRIKDCVNEAVVFSETDEVNPTFSKIVPKIYVHKRLSPEMLDKIFERQVMVRKNPPPGYRMEGKLLLIMDDIMADKAALNSEAFKRIFLQGRHFGIVLMIAVQYTMDLPICARNNLDIIIVLKQSGIKNREKLHTDYFPEFGSKKLFFEAMDEFTGNYSMLVKSNLGNSTSLTDVVFHYRAELVDTNFTLGSPEYLRLAELYTRNPDDDKVDWNEMRRELAQQQNALNHDIVSNKKRSIFIRCDTKGREIEIPSSSAPVEQEHDGGNISDESSS